MRFERQLLTELKNDFISSLSTSKGKLSAFERVTYLNWQIKMVSQYIWGWRLFLSYHIPYNRFCKLPEFLSIVKSDSISAALSIAVILGSIPE